MSTYLIKIGIHTLLRKKKDYPGAHNLHNSNRRLKFHSLLYGGQLTFTSNSSSKGSNAIF